MDTERLVGQLPEFEDRLELIGVLTGAFLVLVGLGTLVGMPWQYANSVVVMLLQLVGIVATIAVGAGLVWLTRTED